MDCPLRNFRGVQKNENKIIQHHPELKLLARELRKQHATGNLIIAKYQTT